MAATPQHRSPGTGAPRSKSARLAAARRIVEGVDQQVAAQHSSGLLALAQFMAAARNYRRCVRQYHAARQAWQEFSTRHPQEDPAHEEHHRRVIAARQALNGADEAFAMAEAGL